MKKEEIVSIVDGIVRTVLRIPPTGPEVTSRKATVGWDSLKHIEIMFAVEERFALEFSESQLADLDSLVKIADAVDQQLSGL